MRSLKNERGFTEFLTMIVMAIIAFLGLIVAGQFKEDKINEAITDYYYEYEVELVEKGVIGEDDWDRKVILKNSEVKYVNVECDEEIQEENSKCEVKETRIAGN